MAERLFRYAGVIAEGSPRIMYRAGLELSRRGRVLATSVLLGLFGCGDPSAPGTVPVPPFLFVSDVAGKPAIHRFEGDSVIRLSADGQQDLQPHSAAGRIVFTSMRDGNAEIYSADSDLGGQERLTNDPWSDTQAALAPDGSTVAFVSNRSGSPRLWLMAADGSTPRMLETASASFVPEGAPAWSPSGQQIAFTSTRTGTSQVFVVGSAGGQPVQLSREATGALQPAWSGDGSSVLYTTESGGSTVRLVSLAGGDARPLSSTPAPLGDATCAGRMCLAVAEPDGTGYIVIFSRIGGLPGIVGGGTGSAREPAFLVR